MPRMTDLTLRWQTHVGAAQELPTISCANGLLFPLCKSRRSPQPFGAVIIKGEILFPFPLTLHSISPLPYLLFPCAYLFLMHTIAARFHSSLLSLYAIQAPCSLLSNDEARREEGDSRRLDQICCQQEGSYQGQEGWIPPKDRRGDVPWWWGRPSPTRWLPGTIPFLLILWPLSPYPWITSWAPLCLWHAASSAHA
jgi:hypothetical protein